MHSCVYACIHVQVVSCLESQAVEIDSRAELRARVTELPALVGQEGSMCMYIGHVHVHRACACHLGVRICTTKVVVGQAFTLPLHPPPSSFALHPFAFLTLCLPPLAFQPSPFTPFTLTPHPSPSPSPSPLTLHPSHPSSVILHFSPFTPHPHPHANMHRCTDVHTCTYVHTCTGGPSPAGKECIHTYMHTDGPGPTGKKWQGEQREGLLG